MEVYQEYCNVLKQIKNSTYEHPITKGMRQLCDLYFSTETLWENAIEELKELQQYCRSKDRAFVLCHSDIHGNQIGDYSQ